MPRLPQILAFSALALPAVLSVSGCADAPITPAQIQANGQLRAGLQQSEFQNLDRPPARQTAQSLLLTAVLAAQSEGALEDSNRFLAGDEATVFLHLRADKLDEPRPVRFTWTYGEQVEETMGFLMPSETLAMAASHVLPVEQAGTWTVQVHEVSPFGTDPLLFERSFEVVVEEDE
jgi:hypothetical protein